MIGLARRSNEKGEAAVAAAAEVGAEPAEAEAEGEAEAEEGAAGRKATMGLMHSRH